MGLFLGPKKDGIEKWPRSHDPNYSLVGCDGDAIRVGESMGSKEVA